MARNILLLYLYANDKIDSNQGNALLFILFTKINILIRNGLLYICIFCLDGN